MRDRKNKCIIGVTTGIWFISLCVFFWNMMRAERISGFALGLYGVWNFMIFSGAYFFISRKVNKTMRKVTESIQSMIDGKPVQNFSMEEESLLGKFQMQLKKLYEISLKVREHGNEVALVGNQNIEAVYDRRWTEEAIFNLLDNGVKYSDPNTPIEVEMEAYDLYVRINIISYGRIIPKEEYTQLFQRFYRGTHAALVKEGVGLGLFLTRQIISGQGGYVKVGNRDGKANEFSVFLLSGSMSGEKKSP